MKTTEAPEKIYLIRNFSSSTALNTTNDYHGKYLYEWYKSREKDADVEYTRTDVFIEKVYDAYCKVCGHYPYTTPNHICRQTCDYYKDFRKYIKD